MLLLIPASFAPSNMVLFPSTRFVPLFDDYQAVNEVVVVSAFAS